MVTAKQPGDDWYVEVLSLAGLEISPRNWKIQGWEFSGPPLGVGGFGATFQATRSLNIGPGLRTRASLKILKPPAASGVEIETLFHREIQALGALSSRFVAKLIDAGIENGLPWIATEFIEGFNLQQRIQQSGPLDLREWATLAEHALRALQSAHDVQLMHLDIKPANIMYSTADDAFAIVDFGLAKVKKLYATKNRNLAGTPLFLAPESYRGENNLSSDIFSLGTSLYEAFAGVNPWFEILSKDKSSSKPWHEVYLDALESGPTWSKVPDGIRSILEPMLAIDLKQRPAPRLLLDEVLGIPRLPQAVRSFSEFEVTSENIFEAWQDLNSKILERLKKSGLNGFKLDVQSDAHDEIFFRISQHEDGWKFTCSVPKNPGNLVAMGWKPGVESVVLTRVLPSSTTLQTAAEVIHHALESGYGLRLNEIRLA